MDALLDLSELNHIPLFRGLTVSELTRLNNLLRSQTFAAGKTIIAADDTDSASNGGIYGVTSIIYQGIVKVMTEEPLDAKPVVLALLGAGQVIGEMSPDGKQGYSATVIALEETVLLQIDHAVLRECLRTMPDLAYNLVTILADRMRHANAQIQSLATQTIRKRVASQILSLACEYGRPMPEGTIRIPFRLTTSDLAEMVGATSVRVYQVLPKLMQHLSIDAQHYITVFNIDGLTDMTRS